MREQLLNSYRKEIQAIAAGPVIELQRDESDVVDDLSPERRAELDEMSGVDAYRDVNLELGPDLMGSNTGEIVRMTLEQCIQRAVQYNLDLQSARIVPAVRQTQITQAEAVFDATWFFNANYISTDAVNTAFTGITPFQTRTGELETGIQKQLVTGGQATVSTSIANNNSTASGAQDSFYSGDIELGITQPLLRGFGTDVNRSDIVLAQNARRADMQNLRDFLIDLCATTETAYWNLYVTKQVLLIQLRLLERTIEDRDRLKARAEFDVNPVRLTEANSFVELRRTDVIRTRQSIRDVSDQLKQLINDPNLPVSSEVMILPVDVPADVAVSYSLLDAVTEAMKHRPDLQVALLDIKDTSIRQRVADNARLPQLDLAATLTWQGFSDDAGTAYGDTTNGQFIDYIVGLQFSQPLGNRSAEAFYNQRQLERRQAVITYQSTAQAAVLEVKDALRTLLTSYELIGATRAARLAAADSLRAIEEQEKAGVALTPEFLLDLKLNTQQRLADAEIQEVQAMADYNNAISGLYQATGTLLRRNRVDFADYAWNQ